MIDSGSILFRLPLLLSLLVLQGMIGCSPKPQFALHTDTEVPGPDPFFSYQWFLDAGGVSSGKSIDVRSVWEAANRGQGINIAVVDPSSIYLRHKDLNSNKDLSRSFNFLVRSRGSDTTFPGGESHGTCVAGVIGARDENSRGIQGVASRALISARTTSGNDVDIMEALSYQASTTDVSSNSYGPPDNVGELNQYYSNDSFKMGMTSGLRNGRGGLGTVYVWAAGNGRGILDRSNYDGYASHFGVMSICSTSKDGTVSTFSEPGSNLWVCAPGENIPATDFQGLNCGNGRVPTGPDFADIDYTKYFTGTSASAPVVSGVVGLVLHEAKSLGKNLGWRDVKMIIAESADKPVGVTWQPTALRFNDDYGFGIVNAQSAVAMMRSWTPVGNSAWVSENISTSFLSSGSISLSENYANLPTLTISSPKVTYIEHIELDLKITHDDPGDLEVNLVKKSGSTVVATSKIVTPHSCRAGNSLEACTTAQNTTYTFGVANFLKESAAGTWELQIRNGRGGTSAGGSVHGWRMRIYGH